MRNFSIDKAVARLVAFELIDKYCVFPIKRKGKTLSLAMTNPDDRSVIEEIESLTQYRIKPMVATESALNETIWRYRQCEVEEDSPIEKQDVLIEDMGETEKSSFRRKYQGTLPYFIR